MAEITATRYGDTLTGTADSDSITGSPGPDLIQGAAGDDTIVSGRQYGEWYTPDTVHGGAGDDRISAPATYGALLFGDAGADTLSTTIVPTTSALIVLEGGTGDDIIEGNAGPQVWAGYITATSGVEVNLGLTTPQLVGGGAGIDVIRNVSGVLGSAFDDVIVGGSGGLDELFGGAGADYLQAGSGGGRLHGDVGNDTLVGGAGSDWAAFGRSFRSEPEFALLPDYPATGGVHVDLSVATAQDVGGGLGVDRFVDIDNLQGTSFADTLTGDARANILVGGGGNDVLRGGAGDDSLAGSGRSDWLLGEAGNDTITEQFGGGRLEGGDGDDLIRGSELGINGQPRPVPTTAINGNVGNDTLVGAGEEDWIRGGKGDDTIAGGGGNDWLSGDRGSDTLAGGAGADTFHAWGAAGLDRVTDFNAAEGDRVLLDAGTSYTVSQDGGDVAIDMAGGARMVLVGVQLSTLPSGWIVVA